MYSPRSVVFLLVGVLSFVLASIESVGKDTVGPGDLRIKVLADLQENLEFLRQEDEDLQRMGNRYRLAPIFEGVASVGVEEEIPVASYEEILERMSKIESQIPLNFNHRVKSFVDYYVVRDRAYSRMALSRKDIYFPMMEEKLKSHGLPDELKYLSVVESGLQTHVRSRAGAVGLWQFMAMTARYYGMKYDFYYDERRDPEKSTEAACKYLKSLYAQFGDWELALAAYNCGPGNVRKAIRRSGYKKTFWEIYRHLPRETRSYVPQFVAITYMFNHAEEHKLYSRIEKHPIPSDTIIVNHFLNLKVVSDMMEVPIEDIRFINPELKRDAVPSHLKGYSLNLPEHKMDYFRANEVAILDSAKRVGKKELEKLAKNSAGSTWGREKVVYRVRRGDVLGRIAARHGVRVRDIKAWNNLRSSFIREGQKLKIYVKSSHFDSYAKSTSVKANQSIPDSGVHLVQPGDSLWSIANKYKGLTIEKIKKLNNLGSNMIKPGQKLIIS
ncbi:lytic transglycosylase domain-containing protein [Aureibacter tunicatorum]|uniref:Membrane-bound lytic murein transglycosylase D n=1 Tax=Aureibacter tunicatorum TaxID=866807 RepID=A0AAE4BRF5_9BACT|nr:LysM peptidoglycan-binding domain-containing protein [Aureibacter tunicatorum]MDR6237730.1 membrane-bound lytic murein transglycosylase D [Aureibacter tunicatorum]BDD02765.1 lytic transglycosylase [Aureibacter tunicatorum]